MAKGLSQRELAAVAGVSASAVHLAETGKVTPRFVVIRKLAPVLGVEPMQIAEFVAAIEKAAPYRPKPRG